MKKIISLTLALMLLLGILAVPALAEDYKVGTLSYLNMTEEEENLLGSVLRANPVKILVLNGVFKSEGDWHFSDTPSTHHYDTLSALLMGLQAGEVEAIRVPYYTAKYLCSTNDTLKLTMEYHPENATELSNEALARLSDGYSFMLKEEDVSLRDEIDAQISAMKEDGTLQKLIDEYIIKASESGETIAVDFEQFEGDSSFAEDFRDKAHELGMQCELYEVTDDLNTHSWYTAGVFVKNRRENKSLDKFWSWVEER